MKERRARFGRTGKQGFRGLAASVAIAGVLSGGAARAEDEKPADRIRIEETTIVGVTPLPGLGQPLDRVPANIQSLGEDEVRKLAPLDVTQLLRRRATGIHLTDTQNNPFQPDLVYRGFTASPLLGTPQGLSVFQDGARVNEFLGDTVNWDLIPQDAIASMQLAPGSDPVYGRNTLGAALAIQTKRGRTHPGIRGELWGGSFDRRRLLVEGGGTRGDFDFLVLGNIFREDGFRDFSESDVNQAFLQLGWMRGATDLNFTYTLARNELRGNGFAPESFLAEDRSAVFTHPDIFEPELDFFQLRGSQAFSQKLRVDGNVYYRDLRVAQFNGDELDEDDDDEGEEEGEDEGDGGDDGEPLPGVNRSTDIDQRRFGGGFQLTWDDRFGALENRLLAGFDGDRGEGDLRFLEQEGFIDERRAVVGTGAVVPGADVETDGDAVGVFATDTVTPFPWMSLTGSIRYDRTHLEIDDRLEGDASGEHTFERVSPSGGVTLRPRKEIHFFGRYAESFRAPTAIELTCASEEDPCPLPIAFAEDPPLEKVVARGFEAGIRARPLPATRLTVAYFRTNLDDDILFVATGRAEGFFRNVDETRRTGVETTLEGTHAGIDWFAAHSWTKATFETTVELPSPEGGNVATPGDELPGVPDHLVKAGFDAPLPGGFRLGVDASWTGEQFLRTDESNRFEPLDDYFLLNARLEWDGGPFTLFARAENLLDEEYETFGTRGENVFADERVERFLSPGAPLGGWFGVRFAF